MKSSVVFSLLCGLAVTGSASRVTSLHGTKHHGSNIAHRAESYESHDLVESAKEAINAASSTSTATSSACTGNTATTRDKWCDYDIYTDYTEVTPETNVTREYWLNLEQVTVAPDGRSRMALAINGSVPGPTIYASWGDWVVVHLTNSLPDDLKNGTSIHFHGIRQLDTNQNDGVVSITQCPTAPNNTITYKWRAQQYGTTWYHFHIGLQAWEGLFGGIVIEGPASDNYDEDKGVIVMNDWDLNTVDTLFGTAQLEGPPELDSALISGTNVFGYDGEVNQTGTRFNTSFEADTSYRLRLINAACDTHFKFMIDNHTMTVITNDLVPIEPYNTTVLNIAMGQRYDVIVKADQAAFAKNFWLRAIPQTACSENSNPQNIKGIVYYGDSPRPRQQANLSPIVSEAVNTPYYNKSTPVTLGTISNNMYRWKLNSTSMHVDWADPTLQEIHRGSHSWANKSGVVELPRKNEWTYVVIETELSVPHPIHLHGHDFVVLSQGSGSYDGQITSLSNPPKRDTAMLPENGHLVIAFKTDNPGAWLMHCHIGWHAEEGFAIQFLERYNEIKPLIDYSTFHENCKAWVKYQNSWTVEEDDSGI